MVNLEPLRTGAAIVWDELDERERMIVVYALAWVVFGVVAALRRRGREQLKQELREELAADAAGSRS